MPEIFFSSHGSYFEISYWNYPKDPLKILVKFSQWSDPTFTVCRPHVAHRARGHPDRSGAWELIMQFLYNWYLYFLWFWKKLAQNYEMVTLKRDSDLALWFFLMRKYDFSFKISISFKTSRSSIFRLRPPRQIAIWPWWNFMKIWKSRNFFGPSTAKSLRRKSKMTQTIEGEKKTNLFRLLWLAVGQTRRLGRH